MVGRLPPLIAHARGQGVYSGERLFLFFNVLCSFSMNEERQKIENAEVWKEYSVAAQKALELGILTCWIEQDGSSNIGRVEDLTATQRQKLLSRGLEAGIVDQDMAHVIEKRYFF